MNHEWLPLTAVTNFSWAEIDAVCQSAAEAAGPCSGNLGAVDLTGWTWASRPEVVALIGEFMVAAGDNTATVNITGSGGYGTMSYSWAQNVINVVGVTLPNYNGNGLNSYTFGFSNAAPGNFNWLCTGPSCVWTSYAAANENYGGRSDAYGIWLYRAAAPVPEPASLALMLAGGTLLLGMKRRAARRKPRPNSGRPARY